MTIFSSILVADDEKNTREGIVRFLEGLNYDVIEAEDGAQAWQEYLKAKPDLILTDIRMPNMDGIELLEKVVAHDPSTNVILLTAYGSVEDAVKAMKKGAYYYLTKPVNLEELEFQVKKALARQSLEEENRELKKALFSEKFDQGLIVTESQVMKEILKTVEKIANSEASVLIEGETGTGKELIAHRIHDLSSRKNQPFVAVHCASLTETLLASELFGHEKGAFTGATERKIGRFERAHQGTLFLDEIGEISPDTQVKLLRVLQNGEFERVGGTKTIRASVRLVCATNKNLASEVKAGRFREDLYYRINVIYLKIPPLRERPNDIPPLVDYFIRHYAPLNNKKITEIDPKLIEVFKRYAWPGNIREVKNIIERMLVLSSGNTLTLDQVPKDIFQAVSAPESGRASGSATVELSSGNLSEMEKSMIHKTLAQVQGNKSLAAKKLGISRRTLYRKIDEYKLE